ncbi:MAG TPA: asparagine synthase-related protein [Candidatus Acidoferrum sp.]|nr:asparagine synthase-related protein [Candidatus Acidoferrum sp.]
MNVQFGRWNFDGQPVGADYLERAKSHTEDYPHDRTQASASYAIAMYFQALWVSREDFAERQPLQSDSGIRMTWDGRLDNREELLSLLHPPAGHLSTDANIVLRAYEQIGTLCFPKLHGDWALALWDPAKQSLFLAKDFIGTRHLFYRFEPHRGITWATVLDPIVKLAAQPFEINEEFVAGYLSTFPSTDLTPYTGVDAVPASTFVEVKPSHTRTEKYWQLDPAHRVRYGKDSDYEEHFRHLFRQSVHRRLRASRPVVAELSGGMDSTSIVSVADELLRDGKAETPRLDTVSFYDDDEPNWNERPYFALVEAKRGRGGYHLNVAAMERAFEEPQENCFFPLPGFDALAVERSYDVRRCLEASDSRLVLSGIGGDEVTGGVPTPIPELQDLFVSLRPVEFFRKLLRFGLVQRRSWLHLGGDVIEEFLPQPIRRMCTNAWIAPWLTNAFVERNRDVFWRDAKRKTLSGPPPSFQESVSALERLRRVLSAIQPNAIARHQATYPYLDRDLLTFLFGVPRSQHVRPGQRRSLLRRALAGIVPSEIFARKRKAYVARHSVVLLETASPAIETLLCSSHIVAAGWVREQEFRRTLAAIRAGQLENIIPLKKTLTLELWLRSVTRCRLLDIHIGQPNKSRKSKPVCPAESKFSPFRAE